MTDCRDPLETIVGLCAEGAHRFGDDPRAIAAFVDGEIDKMPVEERETLRYGLSLVSVPVDWHQMKG